MLQHLSQKSWYKWLCLGLAILMLFINTAGQQILSPLLTLIKKDIIMTNSQAGLLTSSYVIAGIFLPMIIAVMYAKWGVKPVVMIGGAVMILGFALFIMAQSYPLLVAARFISGIGSITFMTSPIIIISMIFKEEKLGAAMGIFGIAPPVSSFIVVNALGSLGNAIGWRGTIGIILGALILIFLTIAFLLHIPNHAAKIGEQEAATKKKIPLGTNLWLLATLGFAFGYSGLSYITFAPGFYQMHGYSEGRSLLITSLYMGLNVFLAPFVGMLMDRDKNNKRRFAVCGLFMMSILNLLIVTPIPTKMLFGVLMGLGTTAPPIAMFSLYADILPPERLAIGPCIMSTIQNIGSALGPMLSGAMLDCHLGYAGMFSVMAMLMLNAAFFVNRINLNNNTNITGG